MYFICVVYLGAFDMCTQISSVICNVLCIVLNCFQNNSVYDSTQFDNGATPVNPLYAASLQSPDSITGYSIDSAQSLEVGAAGQSYQQNYTVQQQ
jgi:hypothetical protein